MAYRPIPTLPPTHSWGLEARYPLPPFHPLVLKIRSGSYCNICGADHGPARAHLDDHPCAHHFSTADAAFLSSAALDVQRRFLEMIPFLPDSYIPVLPGNTIEQERRYLKVRAVERQCRISTALMAGYTWEKFSARRGKWDMAVSVEEVEIEVKTLEGRTSEHFLFQVRMGNGELWAFDPTGCQFGPHWALLYPWEEYERRFVEEMVAVRPLGTMAREAEAAT